ncbi:hypothetical protein CV103_12010 [Sphingomonas fennica]|uniref:Uncharacterized protein n=2 Tax=Edaphosphingomonas fennica TaxID=114404 RepID=A0A2T4HVY1_9SPHN|nr:hypothetical protein CV103_12010 [Sphingomonas fennica]
MKIKMLTSISGQDFALSPDDETDRFTTSEATRLIDAGYAVPVADKATEKAVKTAAPEKRAAKPATKE